MAKLHKRKLRYLSIAPRLRKLRPKSFKSEDSAKKWAESRGMKDFALKNLRRPGANDKKIIVVKA